MNDVAAKLAIPARWLLVMAIAYTLTMSGFYFVAPPATGPVDTVSRQPAAAARPAADLNEILAANLFGTADATAQAEPVDEPAVATRLPLDLLGVFVADHPDNSVAIISQRGRQGLRYTIGEDVPGSATLVEVHPGHVVLRRAGTRETLHFPQPGEGLASTVQPRDAGMDDTFPQMLDEIPQDMPPGFDDPLSQEGEPEFDMDMEDPSVEDLVNEYRQELEQDPAQALEELGMEPVSEGSAEGYRVGDLAHSPYLSQTGLQPGDVILSVNGRPVGDMQSDRLELDNVLAQGSARLEVQRGSRRFFVTASLQ